MDKYTLEALNRWINYAYDEEYKNWEEAGKPERDHIFNDISLIANWADKEMRERGLI